jgi:hypothetical protein
MSVAAIRRGGRPSSMSALSPRYGDWREKVSVALDTPSAGVTLS